MSNLEQQQKLLQHYKDIFSSVIKKYLNPNLSLDNYEINNIQVKGGAIFNDFKKLDVNDDIVEGIYYLLIGQYAEAKDGEKRQKILSSTLFDASFRKKVESLDTWDSEFISFIKPLCPMIDEMIALMDEKKGFLVLKKYEEILNFINIEALNPSMTDKEKEIELKKRYNYPNEKLSSYNTRMKNQKMVTKVPFDKLGYSKVSNESNILNIIQKYLYGLMLTFHKEQGCFFRQYDKQSSIYIIGDLNVIVYDYDDNPRMNLRCNGKNYRWEQKEFWATISSPEFNLKEAQIDSGKYSPLASTLGPNTIIVPREYLEEAIIRKLIISDEYDSLNIDLFSKELLTSLGIDPSTEREKKLLTTNNIYYFKDPRLVDELKISSIDNYDTLKKIREKKEKKERIRYLKYLLTITKNKKEPIIPMTTYKPRVAVGRLPYKD